MNCNPFTLGHRYLIEEAAKTVETLIVFVVREDRSKFHFADRIRLVREGVKDLTNVIVESSGQFMISTETFPEYFFKSQLQEVAIDSSYDVRLFGKYIAPALGITIRFVGEEPFDAVTSSYNRTMHEILPECGVKVVEIPRKKVNGEVISASKVRALLKEGKMEELRAFVPSPTYEYLRQNWRN